MMLVPSEEAYVQFFRAQAGGRLPVFRGQQSGCGFGDFLRGILQRVAPIFLRGASAFLGGMNEARDRGSSWKDSAKAGLAPAAGATLRGAQRLIETEQEGRGKKRRHKKVYKRRHPVHKAKVAKFNF